MKSLWSRAASWYTLGMKRFAAIFAFCTLTGAAQAQTKTIDCYCTDTSGARVELGESICLQVGGRMFTAQCQMSLNVPMWRETQNGCLSSEAVLPFSPLGAGTLDQPVQTFAVDAHI
ncbi:hypothetical protein [Sulfitobacter guttiformis]|uniref:Uncharacterized protein n=1 Tax=Sulfitobacter guttiformis TaxID=74349 RepID=A0A420DMW9_9RHOB|nr:hypothetical protein [Sulfitobacter guttiformis]RKE95509.1 hypothetical protein C8N30_0044 [Sulfitobacter guttiformis]